MDKGYLISFEGGDGSGKSTAIASVSTYLRDKYDLDVVSLREPGGTYVGDNIRGILHDLEARGMTEATELFLFLASRAQNVVENIIPYLEDGKVVLLDRFFDSTNAYQGFARGLGANKVSRLNDEATNGLTPDLTIYYDVDPEIALQRRLRGVAKGLEWTRLDAEAQQFHQKVRWAYQTMYQFDDVNRWEWVDANKSQDEVFCETLRIVENRLQMSGVLEGQVMSPERRG